MVKGELDKSQATANENIDQANRAKAELADLKKQVEQSEGMTEECEAIWMEVIPLTEQFSCQLLQR
jgi:hypothetical protein